MVSDTAQRILIIDKMMMMKKPYLIFLLSFYTIVLSGQQKKSLNIIKWDLTRETYDELEYYFNENKHYFSIRETFAKAYLKKSIADKDPIRQANAYYFLSLTHNPIDAERYANTIVSLAKTVDDTEVIDHKAIIAKGFLAKAIALRRMGKYKEALDHLLRVLKYGNTDNTLQQLEVKYQIGVMKANIGVHKEALDIFRNYLREIEKHKEDKRYAYHYSKALFALGDAYNRNKQYDSAAVINKKGAQFASKNTGGLTPAHFSLAAGITAYHLGDYDTSLDNLQKAEKILAKYDTEDLMTCYFYMGKAYYDQKQYNDAAPYFWKISTISKETSIVFPEVVSAFSILSDFYKYRELFEEFETLIVLIENLPYTIEVKDYMMYKYDAPQIALQKDEKINDLNKDKAAFRTWVISLSLIVLLMCVFIYYYGKKHIYHIRSDALLNGNCIRKKARSKEIGKNLAEGLTVSKKPLNSTMAKLKVFIDKRQFLSNDISLNTLAKLLETNPNYLSKIINFHEQKSFREYISDLRIHYAVEELKTNAIFRKYGIKAIAEETGFKNAKSFTRTFYKTTGVYPSYFIRELEKREQEREAFIRRKNAKTS